MGAPPCMCAVRSVEAQTGRGQNGRALPGRSRIGCVSEYGNPRLRATAIEPAPALDFAVTAPASSSVSCADMSSCQCTCCRGRLQSPQWDFTLPQSVPFVPVGGLRGSK